MHITLVLLVVMLITTLFYIGNSLREEHISYEWCHSEYYNITYKKAYVMINESRELCYPSKDKSKYIAILKARTVLFLEGEDRIILRWRSRNEVITLQNKDEKRITSMLLSMNDLVNKDEFLLPIMCNRIECKDCEKNQLCQKSDWQVILV